MARTKARQAPQPVSLPHRKGRACLERDSTRGVGRGTGHRLLRRLRRRTAVALEPAVVRFAGRKSKIADWRSPPRERQFRSGARRWAPEATQPRAADEAVSNCAGRPGIDLADATPLTTSSPAGSSPAGTREVESPERVRRPMGAGSPGATGPVTARRSGRPERLTESVEPGPLGGAPLPPSPHRVDVRLGHRRGD